MPAPSDFLQYVDDHADDFIKRLADAVAIERCAFTTPFIVWHLLTGCVPA